MSGWVKAAKLSDIPEDTGLPVQLEGKEIALFKNGNGIRAIYAVCPHQGGPLHEGGIHDGKVMCPWHGWEFRLDSGVCDFNDAIKIPVFKVKVEGEDVFVEV